MSEDICFLTAVEMAARIRDKSVSPVELVQAHLDRIDELNSKLNAFVYLADDVLERAKAAEASLMRGDEIGLLHGVPYSLKDCVEVTGLPLTLGSNLFRDNVSSSTAPLAARLHDAGGILLGKTNMPEFALWWETDNTLFGRTDNPWDVERTPGGSSGGEAAAIATGMSPLGVGTDLGGSIREPASFCGIAGIKPTLGRVPYTGVEPQTLLRAIHAGPMARTVEDVALGLSIMAGTDGRDIFAPPVPVPDYMDLSLQPDLRIGWSPTGGAVVEAEVQAAVTSAAETLSEAGLRVEPVEIPALVEHDAGDITAAIYTNEAGLHLAPIIAGREDELTPLLKQRYVDNRVPATLEDYLAASESWEKLRHAVAEYFTQFDLFVCPTTPMPAFPHGQRSFVIDGTKIPGRHALRGTVPWDLTGSPAISVPFDRSSDGLPLAVQMVGRHFEELTVLRVAAALEAARGPYPHPPIG